MSKRFFTSDPHLLHEYVARLRGYQSSAEHDAVFCRSWRETVGKRDSVWVLGDIAVGNRARALEMLHDLPGTKHLIVGNHDACSPISLRAHKYQREYLEVFESVQQSAQIKIAGQRVVMSHFPYEGDHAGIEERYTQWRLRDEGVPLLCGHVHDEWRVRGHQFNVGVDHTPRMRPTSEEEVILWLKAL